MKNVILTGIERSGSSFAVDVFHNYSNTVFLNEPPLEYLPHQPERILEYINDYRKRILSGFPVQNVFKAETPDLAWDTLGKRFGNVESRSYMATYDNEEFVFGFKSLTPMLRHIYTLKQFSSEIMVIAIIRHPVDTIYSQLRYGGCNLPEIPNMDPKLKSIMNMIKSKLNPLERAAWTWRYNTSIILDNLDCIVPVTYDNLMRHTHFLAEAVLQGLNIGSRLRNIDIQDLIKHRDEFTVAGRELIARICRGNAIKLGVWE